MLYTDHSVLVNNINLHYIEYSSKKTSLLFLHGLTGNAHAVDGLVKEGLANDFHIISVDLRGRGLSDRPAFAYSIEDHGNDIIALLDYLKIEKIILCGHSFGGLLASYLAYYYPDRFPKIIILDAAPEMNPEATDMLAPALARIDMHYKNFETYLEDIKKAPYLTFWDPAMESYYKADVKTAADNSVEPNSNLMDIIQIATAVSTEPWREYFINITQPTMLVNALDEYTLGMALLPVYKAEEIVEDMKNCRLVEMNGNHQTMLYGQNAHFLVKTIIDFAIVQKAQ